MIDFGSADRPETYKSIKVHFCKFIQIEAFVITQMSFFTTAAHRTSVEEELSGGEVTTRDSIGAQLLDKLFQLNIDPKKRDRIF